MMTTDPRKFDADRAALELARSKGTLVARSREHWHQKALECAADLARKDAEIEKLQLDARAYANVSLSEENDRLIDEIVCRQVPSAPDGSSCDR
jgi:hypothetical protein